MNFACLVIVLYFVSFVFPFSVPSGDGTGNFPFLFFSFPPLYSLSIALFGTIPTSEKN
jgi:hypothetical protein